jgi:hypothetical protein
MPVCVLGSALRHVLTSVACLVTWQVSAMRAMLIESSSSLHQSHDHIGALQVMR